MTDTPEGPAPGRVAWFHCFAGIAGDMALGALLDAGADLDQVLRLLETLPLRGWSLDAEPVLRGGIASTRAVVRARDDGVARTHAHLVALVEEARLPPRVRDRALATFAALAEVEGRLHGTPPDRVHFHEVGGHDAVVDVVGTCAALEVLGIDAVTASPVATGTGTLRSAHGVLPNPAPAVVGLLEGVPTRGLALDVELTTPTGAAILAANASAYGPLPAMTVEATGYGAGERELEGLPNVTQVVVGRATGAGEAAPGAGQPVVLLEANLDDATGEVLAHAVSALLAAGAHDAWVTPVVMKKGRPGHVITVLADPAAAGALVQVMRSETGTLGVRGQVMERWPEPRRFGEAEVDGMVVRVKVSRGRVKAEHDDAARVARRTGRPVRDVSRMAEEEWRRKDAPAPPAGPPG